MPATSEPEIIEGTWEEIFQQASRLNGRRLRVFILPDPALPPTTTVLADQRLEALDAWLTLSRPESTLLLDDNRAIIYADDEPRG